MKIKSILAFALVVVCLIGTVGPLRSEAAEDITEETAGENLAWPVPGHYTVTQEFIVTPERTHNGIDILDNNISGAPVIAAMGGTVDRVYNCTYHHDTSSVSCYGYGTCVVIKGDDGRCYVYAHLMGGSIPEYVYAGAYITKGTKVGQVGTTGYSYANHLHFVVTEGDNFLHDPIDPLSLSYSDLPDNASELTLAGVRYPLYLKSGTPFQLFGTVFSPNMLISCEVQIIDSLEKTVLKTGVYKDEGKKVFDLSEYASVMDLSSLPDGDYRFVVNGLDERGYYLELSKSFTVGPEQTRLATSDVVKGVHGCDEVTVDTAYRWDEGVVTTESSCSRFGIMTYTCRECGNVRKEVIPALPHDYEEEFTVDSEPNFKGAVGYKSRHCRNCDAVTDVTVIQQQENEVFLPGWLLPAFGLLAVMILIAYWSITDDHKKKEKNE